MFDRWFKFARKTPATAQPAAPVRSEAGLVAAPASATDEIVGLTPADEEHQPLPEDIGRFLLRQPVLNVSQQIIGYEFAFRPRHELSSSDAMQQLSDETLISSVVQLNIRSLTGDKLFFLPIAADLLDSGWVSMLPPELAVLSIDASQPGPVAELAERCRARIEQGFRIAFDNLAEGEGMRELAGLAAYLRFDLRRYNAIDLNRQLDELRAHCKAVVVARQVEDEDDHQAARGMGFDAFQGYYFARRNPALPQRIDNDRLRIMELLNMTAQHAELAELEQAIKHDVLISYKLLAFINSPLNALSKKMESIAQALMFLGYDPLYRWLTLLLFADGEEEARDMALLQNALVRARMAESLGRKYLTPADADALFVIGMFSLLDVLFNLPMEQAIERLNLSENARRALVQQHGPYAPFLRLAIGFENADQQQVRELADALAIDAQALNQIHIDAINWAMLLKN